MVKSVPGVILVVSCQKYLNTRLQELQLDLSYLDWPVIKVIGDPRIETPFKILANDLIVLRCEDSYIHVMKKVVLAIKALLEIYDIQQGILRCGDDLIYNTNNLLHFLNLSKKGEYTGFPIGYPITDKNVLKYQNNFMPEYYAAHPQDFEDELHGIADKKSIIQQCNELPLGYYMSGVMYYLSTSACKLLVHFMQQQDYNVFKYYKEFGYPFIIEDVGVGFVMRMHQVPFTQRQMYIDVMNNEIIAFHTNNYK